MNQLVIHVFLFQILKSWQLVWMSCNLRMKNILIGRVLIKKFIQMFLFTIIEHIFNVLFIVWWVHLIVKHELIYLVGRSADCANKFLMENGRLDRFTVIGSSVQENFSFLILWVILLENGFIDVFAFAELFFLLYLCIWMHKILLLLQLPTKLKRV